MSDSTPLDTPQDGLDAGDRTALLQSFVVETDERLMTMEEALVELETRPDDVELLQAIFRDAHTLKGNAACLGFGRVSEFAHAVEDLLQRLRLRTVAVDAGFITVLLQSVDAMRQMVPDAVAGAEDIRPSHAALRRRLLSAAPQAAEAGGLGVGERDENRRRVFGRRQGEAREWAERTRTLRVEIGKLDQMLNLAGEIATAQGRLKQLLRTTLGRTGDEILEAHRETDRLFIDLQELILTVRMIPLGPLFRQYIRTVRDVSRAHGKLARLVIEGEEVEVDTTIVEALKDSLTHMVRNALAHGIESPETRTRAGKDPMGTVTLRAVHEGGHIVIDVEDDGAGLDRRRIRETARSKGLVADPHALSDDEVCRLIFEPGFSTAETLTNLSGRGMGMDVVRRHVEGLHGSVSVESRNGIGTTLTLCLPLTLAIIEGFAVGVAGDTYVLPLGSVLECMELPRSERRRVDAQGLIGFRGQPLPYLRLRDVFSSMGTPPDREHVVVVTHHRGQAGLVVDTLFGEHQAVIKPLGKLFHDVPWISGSTILGDGRVALILDVPSLLRHTVSQTPVLAA
ncbi:MAG: chemotaxis protein CheA [Nitrospirae bacterium]|nr:chemotaxis protein CheA [Nitrospirota bacterium]